jgi:hypothetical protein
MQFPAGHEEGPHDTEKTDGGKCGGRCMKRTAAKAAPVTGNRRRRGRRPSEKFAGHEAGGRYTKRAAAKEAAVIGSGRRRRRPLQKARLVGRYNAQEAGCLNTQQPHFFATGPVSVWAWA